MNFSLESISSNVVFSLFLDVPNLGFDFFFDPNIT